MTRGAVAALVGLLGCHDGAGDTAAADAQDPCEELGPAPTWDDFTEPLFAAACQSCHGSGAADRQGAPSQMTFDTEAQVRYHSERILRTTTGSSPIMPPGGGVTAEEREQLAHYLSCPD